jgi:hypothetical protein
MAATVASPLVAHALLRAASTLVSMPGPSITLTSHV